MIYLALGILCNVILLVILKSFDKFKIPTLQGIVVNYFVAGTTALFFVGEDYTIKEVVSADYFPVSLMLGALFISIFYLISLTAQKINIAVASVANKMSVVMPVIVAFVLYGDNVTLLKVLAIILALASVFLTTKSDNKGAAKNKSLMILPLLVFFGSGIIDTLVNYANKRLIHTPKEDALFTGFGFYIAGCIGIIWLGYMFIFRKEKFVPKSIIAGIILGIPNFFSIYFILKALSSNVLESSQLYPMANVFIVILSSLAGVILFKEKLSKINAVGILLSVVAIALIMI
ncbi:MAG: EamA/RhaT family transporter [Bacteroidia bacterium]